jgi:hypothetical protein
MALENRFQINYTKNNISNYYLDGITNKPKIHQNENKHTNLVDYQNSEKKKKIYFKFEFDVS